MLPKTYRARLIIYSLLLISFLASALIYTYHYARDLILDEASNNLASAVKMHNTYLEKDIAALVRTTKLLSNNQQLQEYLNLANVNGDSAPLQRLLTESFAWLPKGEKVVLSRRGQPLVGAEHHRLATEVMNHTPWQGEGQTFYLQQNSLELVTVEPVRYRGEIIGALALSHSLQHNWREWHMQYEGGDIFMTKDEQIVFSTAPTLIGLPFKVEDHYVTLGSEIYRAHPVTLPLAQPGQPQLWYGISETRLLNLLLTQREQNLILIVLGTAVILLVGMAIVHSLSQPLSRLMALTGEVAKGNLPDIAKGRVHTEIDVLSNHFADMVQALKQKQTQVDEAHARLKKTAITDTLTGLYNRRHLQDLFPKLLAQATRDRRPITAILCDLDFFKKLNDTYGHLAGDQALAEFAAILKAHSRNNDFLYRMGGEEFLLLSFGEAPQGSKILAEKIRIATSNRTITHKGKAIPLSVSCGLSHTYADEPADEALNQMLSRADKALYRAKEEGRNRTCAYEEMGKKAPPSIEKRAPLKSRL
jgi:diguanylate cyclase (GGDEF)-like protein